MYNSRLPKYAQHANRKRLVKVFCKGICCCTRRAEMNTDCPDAEVLRTFQMGDLTATCLKCGHIARDPYNWVLPRSRPTSGPEGGTLAPVRADALRADDPLNIPITTLGTSELVDAIEQFCAGDSLPKVVQSLQERSDIYFYEWNQELTALSKRVQERVQANLADLTDKVLRTTVSPATKKYYETAISLNWAAAGATLDKKSVQLTSARRILDMMYDIIKERELTWHEVQETSAFWCGSRCRELMLLVRVVRSSEFVDYQEQWTESISTGPCKSDQVEQQKTASDLDRMIDEVLQFRESRRVLGVVVDHACAQLAEHRTAEKVIGVPSVAAVHDLNALLTIAEDLRKVELNQTAWRLRRLGWRIPTKVLSGLLTGKVQTLWPPTLTAAC